MASLYVVGGVYYIKYHYRGQVIRKSLRTRDKDKAQDDLEEIAARVRLNLLGLPSPHSSPTIQELLDEYLLFSKGKNDPRTYRDHTLYVHKFLSPAFGHIPADQLTDRHIEQFVALLRSRKDKQGKPHPYHPETINKRLKFLRQVLRRAARPGSGVIDTIPVSISEHMQKVPRSLPKYVTPQQFALWWPHVHKPVNKLRAVIEICTGIPDSELARMTWHDNYSEEIGVLKYKRKKTKYDFVVKLNKWALEAIVELKKLQRGPYIFRGVKDSRKAYEIASANSGIKVTPHMLRHSFATWALSDGIGIERVKEALGHASSTTTQIYARVMPQFLAETTGAIDRMRPAISLLPAPKKPRRAQNGHSENKKD